MEDAPQGAEGNKVMKGEEMFEVLTDGTPTVLRKQIIILETKVIMRQEQMEALKRNVLEQMKDGVVMLPNYVEAKVADADTIALPINCDNK